MKPGNLIDRITAQRAIDDQRLINYGNEQLTRRVDTERSADVQITGDRCLTGAVRRRTDILTGIRSSDILDGQ